MHLYSQAVSTNDILSYLSLSTLFYFFPVIISLLFRFIKFLGQLIDIIFPNFFQFRLIYRVIVLKL
jgi:hypothetical protein